MHILIVGQLVWELFFFFQAEDGIRDLTVTGVQTCALPICWRSISVLKQAEIERQRIETLANAERQRLMSEAEGRAASIRAQGEAEAEIIFKKGEAEAKAMNIKAEAFQEYNQAAVFDKLITGLPEDRKSVV